MNSSEFDQRFDEGESVLEALDLSGARRRRLEQKRVNVDFPVWMVEQLDREAKGSMDEQGQTRVSPVAWPLTAGRAPSLGPSVLC